MAGDGRAASAPRVFGLLARDAPVVAVLRRGPGGWTHLGRWDLAAARYEPGSWLSGDVHPQRCDLSPDGRYLAYLALGGRAPGPLGSTYVAVSRLPWLTPLAAWGTGGTAPRGLHFAPAGTWEVGPAEVGDAAPLRFRHGLAWTDAWETYAVQRRGGWVEGPGTPLRLADRRHRERHAGAAVMVRHQPHGAGVLSVRAGRAAEGDGPESWWSALTYTLDEAPLEGVQWADWSPIGRLLVATTDGRLQMREAGDVVWEHDLAGMRPDESPDPAQARHW